MGRAGYRSVLGEGGEQSAQRSFAAGGRKVHCKHCVCPFPLGPGTSPGCHLPKPGGRDGGRARGVLSAFPIPPLRKTSTNPCFREGFRARANPGAAGINNRIALHRGGGEHPGERWVRPAQDCAPLRPCFIHLFHLMYLFFASPRDANASLPHPPGWVGDGGQWEAAGVREDARTLPAGRGDGGAAGMSSVCVYPRPGCPHHGETPTPPFPVPSPLSGRDRLPAHPHPAASTALLHGAGGNAAVLRSLPGARWRSRRAGGGQGQGQGQGWEGRCRARACTSICWCRGVRGAIFVSNKRRRGRRSTRVPCKTVG